MALLSASGIMKSYWYCGRRHPVLAGIGLEAEPGQIVGILGPSGTGKSTLLRILAGLEEPDQGTVTLAGRPVRPGHPDLAVMFQDPCLLPWLTVRENVAFGLRFCRPQAAVREAVDAALGLVGLEAYADWYPDQLSGGMAQRAALARAVARRPRVLLLDEPLSALDPLQRRQLQDRLREIVQGLGMGAVLVTHDAEEALYLADRLLVLGGRPGQVVLDRRVPLPWPRNLRSAAAEELRAELAAALAGAPAGAVRPQDVA